MVEELKHRTFKENITSTENGTSSLLDLIIKRYRSTPNDELYGIIKKDKIHWKSSSEFLNEAGRLSLYLRNLVKERELIGIFSNNRYEWVLAQHATYFLKCIDCPLYSTFGVSAIKHVIDESEMEICFLSEDKANYLLKKILKDHRTTLKHLIVFDEIKEKEEFKKFGIQIHFLKEILRNNESFDLERVLLENDLPKINDVCTVCYTSGTTGNPKGVILTHKNFLSILASFDRSSGEFLPPLNEKDVHLSFLPLSHVFERITQLVFIYHGGRIVFYSGIINNLLNDIQLVKPSILVGVPQIFGRIKKEIESKIKEKGRIMNFIFRFALNYKIKRQNKGIYASNFFDSFIFNKIKEKFGGRVRAIFGGGSLIDSEYIKFMQACFSCKMFVGYGSTETTGVISCTNPLDFDYDSIGTPFPCTKVKLVEVEDLPNKFELYAKGDSIFTGYYKNDKATKESFEDGWFMTGDLVKYENKVLKIVGRKKDIFKTSRAEYIAPEKLEQLFTIEEIEDILVIGKSTKSFIVMIVTCLGDYSDEYIKSKIMAKANKAYLEKEIPSYEIPHKILVRRTSFDDLGEIKTPTLKKKRAVLEDRLKEEIDKLFDD